MPGQPCQLAECVQELREAMEPLMMFTDEEVLSNDVPLHWAKITSSRTSEPAEPASSWEWSHSRSRRAHTQGSFAAAHGLRSSKPTVAPQVMSPSPTCKWKVLPPGYVEIAKSLWGDNSPCITIEVPQEMTIPKGLLVGTATATMVSTRLHQVSGATYLDMVTTSMSLVGLEAAPMVVDHPMPILEGGEDWEAD